MNAFVDCGAFRGKTIKKFRAIPAFIGKDFKIFAFECNPALSYIKYGDDVTVIRKAIWTANEKLSFYLSKKHKDFIEGSSVYREKITGNLDRENPVTVDAIDFSAWMRDTFAPDDYVIVKMNIEGAEYNVLPKMIEDGTIKLIKKLILQWHWKKINMPESQHLEIKEKLKATGIEVVGYKGILK